MSACMSFPWAGSDMSSGHGQTMSLREYLREHFVDKAGIAALVGVSLERFDHLLAIEAVPSAT